MNKLLLSLIVLLFAATGHAADNLVIVTIDGLRWQEVFGGYDAAILANGELTKDAKALRQEFDGKDAAEKRRKLMPFLWNTISKRGVLVGNRARGSKMEVTNPWWFSYPGYNEILTGRADPQIDSNDPVPNRNATFLEWLENDSNYRGSVAAFGSWDVFPAILNRARSGIYVNAGFEAANWAHPSARAGVISEMLMETPHHWDNVRFDAYTYGLAKEYLLQKKPRLLYIALGETDDFAHDKEYDQYLQAAHRTDAFIGDLWRTLQSLDQYRGNTNLIITVDHGRGRDPATWPHHSSAQAIRKSHPEQQQLAESGIVGSNEIWFAALGPGIKTRGEISGGDIYYQNQVAATALKLLDKRPQDYAADIGPPMDALLSRPVK